MPQFDSTTYASQIFWLVICFMVLCLAMKYFLMPRLTAVLEERNQRLQEKGAKIKSLTNELDNFQKENRAFLAQSHQKAHSMLKYALHEAHVAKITQTAAFDKKIKIKTKKLRKEISTQNDLVLADQETILAQVVTVATKRLLGYSFSKSQIYKAIGNVLDQSGRL
jgi:F-type H+-transporting ATPase subunit b